MKLRQILLEIERDSMPQVRGKEIPDALDIMRKNGIAYRHGKIAVSKLRPTQENGNIEKVDSMASDIKNGETFPPSFISRDGSIIDGHHRILAFRKVFGPEYKTRVIQVMLPRLKCLAMFKKIEDEV